MNIALSSLPIVWQELRQNKILCEHDISISATQGCDLIVFPEMTLTGYGKESIENVMKAGAYHFFLTLALIHRIYILFGWVRYENGKYYNSATLCSDKGVELFTYNKIHPFTFAKEDQYITKGDTLCFSKLPFTTLSPAICYDLRFPEMYRKLAQKAETIVTIASWPQSREDHLRTLLKARAIENQVFSIGVNRSKSDNEGITYSGIPYVYGPDGTLFEGEKLHPYLYKYKLDNNLVKKESLIDKRTI